MVRFDPDLVMEYVAKALAHLRCMHETRFITCIWTSGTLISQALAARLTPLIRSTAVGPATVKTLKISSNSHRW